MAVGVEERQDPLRVLLKRQGRENPGVVLEVLHAYVTVRQRRMSDERRGPICGRAVARELDGDVSDGEVRHSLRELRDCGVLRLTPQGRWLPTGALVAVLVSL